MNETAAIRYVHACHTIEHGMREMNELHSTRNQWQYIKFMCCVDDTQTPTQVKKKKTKFGINFAFELKSREKYHKIRMDDQMLLATTQWLAETSKLLLAQISKLNRNWYDEIRIDSLCVCLCVNCAHCALHSIDWYPIPQSNCCCLSGTLNWCSQSNQCSLQPTETTVFGVRHSDRFQSFAHFDDVDNDGTDELLIVH